MVQTVLISGGTSGIGLPLPKFWQVKAFGPFFWEEMKSGDRRPRSRSGEAFTFPAT